MAASSTAEAPVYSERERRDQIVWFLRATVSPADAEALASNGYRALPRCGGCCHCAEGHGCNQELADSVRVSGRRPSADPRHVRAIVARYGQFPGPVVVRTGRALASLPTLQRLVLLLHDGAGIDQEQVGRQLKVSRSTVSRARESGLRELVRQVWESST